MRGLATRVHSGADVLDSRDVIERINELESELEDQHQQETEIDEDAEDVRPVVSFEEWLKVEAEGGNDDAADLVALRELAEQGESATADWRHGETLIRDSYFEEYARELADDIGAVKDTGWPVDYIDWERAADALKMDYTSIEYGDVTYWVRS